MLISLTASSISYSQSSQLPNCQGIFEENTWSNCFGILVREKYVYVGEWLDNYRNGLGVQYSSNGQIIQTGVWKKNILIENKFLGSDGQFVFRKDIPVTNPTQTTVSKENEQKIRLDLKTSKGCKYSEMVSEERLESRKENKINWTGKCQGEYISGSGTLKILSSNGDKQTINVNFSNGFENGEGESNTETNDSKSKFKGTWINGFRSYGTSVTSYSNGTSLTYTGQFAEGFRNGAGKLVTINPSTAISLTYIGNFTNNKYDGKGRLEDITSSINYEGLFKNGLFINGKIIYKNGAVYEGDVKHFRPDGTGLFKYPSGETYAGGFVEGMKEGNGELTYSNGSVIYKGSFRNDLMDGRGQFIFNNGDSIEEGYSIKGKRSGEWVIKKLNGDIYYVEFENGIKTKVTPAASNQAEVQKAQVNAQNRNTAVINCQNFTKNQTANRDYSAGGSAGGAVVIGLLAGVQNQAIFDDCMKGYGY
jgi:hypothetical protein